MGVYLNFDSEDIHLIATVTVIYSSQNVFVNIGFNFIDFFINNKNADVFMKVIFYMLIPYMYINMYAMHVNMYVIKIILLFIATY